MVYVDSISLKVMMRDRTKIELNVEQKQTTVMPKIAFVTGGITKRFNRMNRRNASIKEEVPLHSV
jgi:hypothetical protein